MAIQLTVSLNDAEQAYVTAVAAQVAPGATPAQIKMWAERVCKTALRDEVQRRQLIAVQESENIARRDKASELAAGWPD